MFWLPSMAVGIQGEVAVALAGQRQGDVGGGRGVEHDAIGAGGAFVDGNGARVEVQGRGVVLVDAVSGQVPGEVAVVAVLAAGRQPQVGLPPRGGGVLGRADGDRLRLVPVAGGEGETGRRPGEGPGIAQVLFRDRQGHVGGGLRRQLHGEVGGAALGHAQAAEGALSAVVEAHAGFGREGQAGRLRQGVGGEEQQQHGCEQGDARVRRPPSVHGRASPGLRTHQKWIVTAKGGGDLGAGAL